MRSAIHDFAADERPRAAGLQFALLLVWRVALMAFVLAFLGNAFYNVLFFLGSMLPHVFGSAVGH